MNRKILPLKVKEGITIYASTGRVGYNQLDRMSSWHFYKALKGSRLHLIDKNYYYNVATYTKNFDEKYIYTYDYEPEESWTTYAHDLSGDTYIQEDYIFDKEVYFRVCLKRADGANFTKEEAEKINHILRYETPINIYQEKECFLQEIKKVAKKIISKKADGCLTLCVLTDSHYTIHGTWEDTINNIRQVHTKTGFDSIVHLGDLTDGMVPADITKTYVKQMINDLLFNQVTVHIVIGNHDSNYFKANPEILSEEEQCDLYHGHDESKQKEFNEQLYYYVDYAEHKVRCIFLASFDNSEKIRYGFPKDEVIWLSNVLTQTPNEYVIVVFSHDAPLAKLDYWANEIRNGEELVSVLNKHNARNHNILAYIHGHTHADYCYMEESFPIISIGCNKCEEVLDKKTPEMVTPARRIYTVTQDLWDTVIIDPINRKIDFIRFGAGEDRVIRGSR